MNENPQKEEKSSSGMRLKLPEGTFEIEETQIQEILEAGPTSEIHIYTCTDFWRMGIRLFRILTLFFVILQAFPQSKIFTTFPKPELHLAASFLVYVILSHYAFVWQGTRKIYTASILKKHLTPIKEDE